MAPDCDLVLARAACLWVVRERVRLDLQWQTLPHADRRPIVEEGRALAAWMAREQIAPTPDEQRYFASLVGAWPAEMSKEMSWRAESLAVLLWAVSLREHLLPYDTQAASNDVDGVFATDTTLADVTPRAKLRPAEMLVAARAEARTWRDRAARVEPFYRKELGLARRGDDTPKRTAPRVRKALGEDVVLFGKPYQTLDGIELAAARAIATERSHALRWLCEGGPWDGAPSLDPPPLR